jgi:hypothetical protein
MNSLIEFYSTLLLHLRLFFLIIPFLLFPLQPLSEKPDNCDSLFLGNLSFQITEEAIYEFFGEEISANIRVRSSLT